MRSSKGQYVSWEETKKKRLFKSNCPGLHCCCSPPPGIRDYAVCGESPLESLRGSAVSGGFPLS